MLGGKAVGWQASNTDIYDGKGGDMPACVGILMGGGKNSDEEQRMIMPATTLGTGTEIASRLLHHAQLWGIHTDYDKEMGCYTFDSYYLRINLAGMQGKVEDVACIEAAIGECPYVANCVGVGDRKEMVADLKERAKHKQADKHWAPLAIGRYADMQKAKEAWGERLLANGQKMDVQHVRTREASRTHTLGLLHHGSRAQLDFRQRLREVKSAGRIPCPAHGGERRAHQADHAQHETRSGRGGSGAAGQVPGHRR